MAILRKRGRVLETLLFSGSWAYSIFQALQRMGPFGLLLLGALDSSFLFLPFGNDLLLIALTTESHSALRPVIYVLAASAGSMVGVVIVDLLMRQAGEAGLERFLKPRRMKGLKTKVGKRAGWAAFLGSLVPPPFPFTAVVMTASALQVPRRKLYVSVACGRLLRFSAEVVLAVLFGRQLLSYINSRVIEYSVYGLILVAVVGSTLSVVKWVRASRTRPARRPEPEGSSQPAVRDEA